MRHFYLGLILFVVHSAMAQPADTATSEDIYIPVKKYPYIKTGVNFGALSNSLSAVELWNFVNDDFLDGGEKSELLESIPSSLRYGYHRSFEAAYYQPGYAIYDAYNPGWGIGVRNTYYNSASISKDMLNLIFYGNKPYAGTTVEAGQSNVESWYFSSIDYHFDVLIDTILPIHFTASIHAGHDHSHYKVQSADIYTDPVGEFLEMDLDYSIKEKTGQTPLNGLGVSVGASMKLPLAKKNSTILLTVNDFGLMHWNSGEVLNVDSSFTFQGVYFSNIFDLNDSLENYASDEYKGAFYYSENRNYTALMPFSLLAQYSTKIAKYSWLDEVFVAGHYRYLSGYYPQLRLGAIFNTGKNQTLSTIITGGGYTWASLNIGYAFAINHDWKFNMAIRNINGLIIPVMSGGAYGALSVSYRL